MPSGHKSQPGRGYGPHLAAESNLHQRHVMKRHDVGAFREGKMRIASDMAA